MCRLQVYVSYSYLRISRRRPCMHAAICTNVIIGYLRKFVPHRRRGRSNCVMMPRRWRHRHQKGTPAIPTRRYLCLSRGARSSLRQYGSTAITAVARLVPGTTTTALRGLACAFSTMCNWRNEHAQPPLDLCIRRYLFFYAGAFSTDINQLNPVLPERSQFFGNSE